MLRKVIAATLSFGLIGATISAPVHAQDGDNDGIQGRIKHVLLISVDGLHTLDLANYVNTHYVNTHSDSTLAALGRKGITFTNASTSSPSDSFPGLATLVTGGSPVTAGLWYDDTYNRRLSPPVTTDGLGNPGGPCPGKIGTNVAWDEAVDRPDQVGRGWRDQSQIPDPRSQQRMQDHSAMAISAGEYDFRSGEISRRSHSVDR